MHFLTLLLEIPRCNYSKMVTMRTKCSIQLCRAIYLFIDPKKKDEFPPPRNRSGKKDDPEDERPFEGQPYQYQRLGRPRKIRQQFRRKSGLISNTGVHEYVEKRRASWSNLAGSEREREIYIETRRREGERDRALAKISKRG